MKLWTVGHSTLSIDAFVGLLTAHGIGQLADVRRFPASRRHPHFNAPALAASLAAAGIAYLHFPELGGRRPPRPDSPNSAWRDPGFRGYADYMETEEFRQGMERLTAWAAAAPTAVMCAEAVWWHCHRGLIADWLKAAGWDVLHIADAQHARAHPWTPPARVVDGHLTYRGLL